MEVDVTVNGVLHKSIDINELDEDMLNIVIDELRRHRESLEKQQFGMIQALQEKGLPQNTSGKTAMSPSSSASNTINTTATASQEKPPSIAEQINFGGQFKPVNKKEKVKYATNGQWDIQPIEKGSEDTTTEWSGSERRKKMNLNVEPIKERRGEKKEVKLPFAYKEPKTQAKDDLKNAKTAVENAKRATSKEDRKHALDTAKASLNRAKKNLQNPQKKRA